MSRRVATAVALALLLGSASGAGAADAPPAPDEEHHTPLAGKPYKTVFLGEPVEIPARDRGDVVALSLGASLFTPPVGTQRVVPFAAFYLYEVWAEREVRATIAALVNEVDFAEGAISLPAGRLEGLAHFQNYTIPFPTTEIIDGADVSNTSLLWGQFEGRFGAGYRLPVWPYEVDNAFRVEALYEVGYLYLQRPGFAGLQSSPVPIGTTKGRSQREAPLRVPPNTLVHGAVLRTTLDAFERNLMELPQRGFALGVEAEFLHRDRWSDQGTPGLLVFERDDTRDYVKLSAYVAFATQIPFLSERHRFLTQVHAGFAPLGKLDRFSSFRLGGGPMPTEAADLARSPYPGASFDQFSSREYVLGTLEYRYEVAFFFFLHVRGTIAYGEVPTLRKITNPPGQVSFIKSHGESVTFGITSGFLWDSTVTVDYTYDLGVVRAGTEGHSLLLTWSKAF